MIQTYTYITEKKGPHILLLGAIHGNEKAGTKAIQKFMKNIQNKKIQIQKGSITCIPICNQIAYKKNSRQYEQNLNRVMKKRKKPKTYEQKIANNITTHIDKCDRVIDLHSTHTSGNPFVCNDYVSLETNKLCSYIPVQIIVENRQKLSHAQKSRDTMKYAHSRKKFGLIIECGKHEAKETQKKAYDSILAVCKSLCIIGGEAKKIKNQTRIEAKKTYIKEKEGGFTQNRKDFSIIKKNEDIAIYKDGEKIIAPNNGYILIPRIDCPIQEERFYFGTKVTQK